MSVWLYIVADSTVMHVDIALLSYVYIPYIHIRSVSTCQGNVDS